MSHVTDENLAVVASPKNNLSRKNKKLSTSQLQEPQQLNNSYPSIAAKELNSKIHKKRNKSFNSKIAKACPNTPRFSPQILLNKISSPALQPVISSHSSYSNKNQSFDVGTYHACLQDSHSPRTGPCSPHVATQGTLASRDHGASSAGRGAADASQGGGKGGSFTCSFAHDRNGSTSSVTPPHPNRGPTDSLYSRRHRLLPVTLDPFEADFYQHGTTTLHKQQQQQLTFTAQNKITTEQLDSNFDDGSLPLKSHHARNGTKSFDATTIDKSLLVSNGSAQLQSSVAGYSLSSRSRSSSSYSSSNCSCSDDQSSCSSCGGRSSSLESLDSCFLPSPSPHGDSALSLPLVFSDEDANVAEAAPERLASSGDISNSDVNTPAGDASARSSAVGDRDAYAAVASQPDFLQRIDEINQREVDALHYKFSRFQHNSHANTTQYSTFSDNNSDTVSYVPHISIIYSCLLAK